MSNNLIAQTLKQLGNQAFRKKRETDRWRPQQTDTITDCFRLFRVFCGTMIRIGERESHLLGVPPKVIQAKEMTVLAVALMMVLCVEMSCTMHTVVMRFIRFMVDMNRRHHYHRQVCRQQYPRCYVPKPIHQKVNGLPEKHHLKNLCKDTSFFSPSQIKVVLLHFELIINMNGQGTVTCPTIDFRE